MFPKAIPDSDLLVEGPQLLSCGYPEVVRCLGRDHPEKKGVPSGFDNSGWLRIAYRKPEAFQLESHFFMKLLASKTHKIYNILPFKKLYVLGLLVSVPRCLGG